MSDVTFNLRACYNGIFYKTTGGQLRYTEGDVRGFTGLDPDLISRVELLAIFKEDIPLTGIKELWYLIPGMTIDKGLLKIETDTDAVKMTTHVSNKKWISIYIVRDSEISPSDLCDNGPSTTVGVGESSKSAKSGNGHGSAKSDYTKEAQVSPEVPKPARKFGTMRVRNPTTEKSPRALRNRPFKSPVLTGSISAPEFGKEAAKSAPESWKDVDRSLEGLWDNTDVHSEGDEIEMEIAESETDSEYSFVETDEENDKLFEEFVDLDVQEGIGEFDAVQEERQVLEDIMDHTHQVDSEVDQDDLGFVCGSDEEGNRQREEMFNPLTDFKHEMKLKAGMFFPSNAVLRKALQQYSIEKGGDYYYLHNSNKKLSVYCTHRCDCKLVNKRQQCKCKENGKLRCRFTCTARVVRSDGSFQIKTFNPKHDCGWQNRNRKVTSRWLSEKYLEHFKEDPNWKLRAFMAEVKRVHGFDITYGQAWKAKSRALQTAHGDSASQYALLHRYAATILRYNPGSSVVLKINQVGPPVFERIYVCYDACKKGFITGCRPVIGVDGCHLRGAVTGQILTAVGLDGNNNIFPIAFAVVEAERRETWAWFLANLMNDVGEANPTFMSDRQKGLIEELSSIVPISRTRVCVRHMHNNFKAQWPGRAYKDAIWAAARAYIKPDFDMALEEIKNSDERAFHYLMSQDPQTWARHGFDTRTKCDILLNNICESFNSLILPARDKPILSQCEWIKRALMARFVAKREQVKTWQGNLTPYARRIIEQAKVEGTKRCSVTWGGGDTREVDHSGRTYLVDIPKQSCSCNKWNLTGIPCAHVMAVIVRERLDVELFVSDYYSKDRYMRAYGEVINGMPGMLQYEHSDQAPPLPPKYVSQPGRPKKNARRREEGEEIPSANQAKKKRLRVGPVKCSNCRQVGHRANKCTNAKFVPEPPLPKKKLGRPKGSTSTAPRSGKKRTTKNKAAQPQPGSENAQTGDAEAVLIQTDVLQDAMLQVEHSQAMLSQVTS